MKPGAMIKKLRKEKGYSQEEFAKILGIGRSTLANYEQCKREPSYEIIETIAKKLNVNPSHILGWDKFLDYVAEEDRDIVKWAFENNLHNYEYLELNEEENAIKILLNSFGYDLKKQENGYFLFTNSGSCNISKNKLDGLISSTKEYLEFNAKKISDEEFGWKDGTLHFSPNNNSKK